MHIGSSEGRRVVEVNERFEPIILVKKKLERLKIQTHI